MTVKEFNTANDLINILAAYTGGKDFSVTFRIINGALYVWRAEMIADPEVDEEDDEKKPSVVDEERLVAVKNTPSLDKSLKTIPETARKLTSTHQDYASVGLDVMPSYVG